MNVQLKRVMNLYETFSLVQVNHMPERDNKSLLFTKDVVFFTDIEVKQTYQIITVCK